MNESTHTHAHTRTHTYMYINFYLFKYGWLQCLSARVCKENFVSPAYRIYSGLVLGNLLSPKLFNAFVDDFCIGLEKVT